MNLLKSLTVAVALFIGTSAFAAGETEKRALSSEQAVKMEMYDRIDRLDIQNFNLKDCTVEVTFSVDADGNVSVLSTAGASCLANEYIKLRMEARKLFVTENLQNKDQKVKLRYVVI